MPEMILQPGERLDDLGVRGWRLIQHPDFFRFSLDAVLLAHFAHIGRNCRAADLGAGTGAVALLLLALGAVSIDAVDHQPRLAEMLRKTIQINGLQEFVRNFCCDVRNLDDSLQAGRYDLVTANPPFRNPSTGRVSPNENVAQARHETVGDLNSFILAAARLLKQRGRYATVHLPERLVDILSLMREAKLEPKRLRMVHSFAGSPPSLVLVEGVKQAKPGLSVLPPLIVYESPGRYHSEILTYYRQENESVV